MNQYLPGVQPSKSCFVRLRFATECRHLGIILNKELDDQACAVITMTTELHENVFKSYRRNCIRSTTAVRALNLADVAFRRYAFV